jgi:hypothetical protein
MNQMSAEQRIAPKGEHQVDGPVTLMNRFAVRPERDEAFQALWTETSKYFMAQPGFVSVGQRRQLAVGGGLPGGARHRRVPSRRDPAGVGRVPERATPVRSRHGSRVERGWGISVVV